MTPVFLYGTLCHLPLLETVAGEVLATRRARLPGHSVFWAEGGNYPVIRVSSHGEAEGLLVEVGDTARNRLSFYEEPYGYRLIPVEVFTESGPVAAQMYWPDESIAHSGVAWSLADWQRDWGAIITRGAGEVMAAFGRQGAQEVAGRFAMILARAQAYENTAAWQRPRTLGRKIGANEVRIEAQAYDHLGFFTLEHLDLTHPRIHGGDPMRVNRAVFRAGEAVTVLPYDPVRDLVLLIEQFRAAPFAQGDRDPWLLEPVAGIIDAGETAQDAARREAVEEAGVMIGELHFVSRYYPSPGATAQLLHSYIGTADLGTVSEGAGGLAEEGEDIALHLVPFEQAMKMVHSGEIAVAPLILSLQWLAMRRSGLA